MARAMQCDRCKGFFLRSGANTVITFDEVALGFPIWHRTMDLCPECAKQLKVFLDNKDVKSIV